MALRGDLREYLAAQVRELRGLDSAIRSGDPEAVHQVRVAARRVRATLATTRSLVDHDRADAVRGELRWLGQLLGELRDHQVLQERLVGRLDRTPPDLVVGPVRERLDQVLARRTRDARDGLRAACRSDRYGQLTGTLAELERHPPWQAGVGEPDDSALRALVAAQVDRVLQRAGASSPTGDRGRALHEVRKAAKQARYAAELAVPSIGKPAKRLARRMKGLQDTLGEHQDAVTAGALLIELATAADSAGENGFTYGVLLAEEHAAARAARSRYPTALQRATNRKATGWTSAG